MPANVRVIHSRDFIRARADTAILSPIERFDQARFFALRAENHATSLAMGLWSNF